jgi:PAS domain S-box-containing protein
VASRFAPEINKLRAALRGKRGADLIDAVRRQIARLPVATLAADNSSRYVATNAAAEALTGYSADELLRLTVTDLTPASSTEDGAELWEHFVAQGFQRGEYELRPKAGRPIRVRYWAYASVAPGIHVSLLVPEASAEA